MKIKKILATTLATAMVIASAMTVFAGATGQSGASSAAGTTETGKGTTETGKGTTETGEGTNPTTPESKPESDSSSSPVAPSSSSSSSSSDSSSDSAKSYAEKATVASNAVVKVAGLDVKTSVSGIYAANSVQGCAVTTDLTTVKANLGLKDGQTPKIVIDDTDAKKSDKAMACINAAAESLGAKVITALNIDLGAVEKGKWIELKDGSIALAVGLPKDADTTKTYSVICVQPGGVVTILDDLDTNPKTVTFNVNAGLGTYAIVAK